ncbi:hypothetical protein [Paraburkholderia phenazinium]|uniref:hypothetical protein n=1 Tax=Paraburkholderia phenazinium TaxID=60549 RepID=UPI00115FCADA|nr:hypothetical protein [Paraburkholderia phenazinium]
MPETTPEKQKGLVRRTRQVLELARFYHAPHIAAGDPAEAPHNEVRWGVRQKRKSPRNLAISWG